jgi:hypothetical protein
MMLRLGFGTSRPLPPTADSGFRPPRARAPAAPTPAPMNRRRLRPALARSVEDMSLLPFVAAAAPRGHLR